MLMAYVRYNPNPQGKNVGDCVIRCLTLALPSTWQGAYVQLCVKGLKMFDMPSANHVWGALLKEHGYVRHALPNECPDCYTIREFCNDHPEGYFVVATGTHVVMVIDGDYMDSWDSGDETPLYYFERQDNVQSVSDE